MQGDDLWQVSAEQRASLGDLIDSDEPHLTAWRWWNRAIGGNGDVGAWHETYVVDRSAIDSIYLNMPAYGLAKATGVVPVAHRKQRAADLTAEPATDNSATLHDCHGRSSAGKPPITP